MLRSAGSHDSSQTSYTDDNAARVGSARATGLPRVSALLWKIAAGGTRLGRPRGLLMLWPLWEHLVYRFQHLKPIPDAPYGLLVMRFIEHQGPPIDLPDGTTIRHGTAVGQFHCDNRVIVQLIKSGVSPFSACRADLQRLQEWMTEIDPSGRIVAFYGVTMLGTAAHRLGFTVRRREIGLRARLDRWFMTGLLLLYTRGGMNRLGRGLTLRSWPSEVWLSRKALRRHYARRSKAVEAEAVHT